MLSCGMYSFWSICLGLPYCLSSHSGCLYQLDLTKLTIRESYNDILILWYIAIVLLSNMHINTILDISI